MKYINNSSKIHKRRGTIMPYLYRVKMTPVNNNVYTFNSETMPTSRAQETSSGIFSQELAQNDSIALARVVVLRLMKDGRILHRSKKNDGGVITQTTIFRNKDVMDLLHELVHIESVNQLMSTEYDLSDFEQREMTTEEYQSFIAEIRAQAEANPTSIDHRKKDNAILQAPSSVQYRIETLDNSDIS
jgi:hypothetical protein